MARKSYATGETQSVFFRACDITKPAPPVLRHGGPCFDWGAWPWWVCSSFSRQVARPWPMQG